MYMYSRTYTRTHRYALRAVDEQLYVWNLDTKQLTAIVQHERAEDFVALLVHPLHATIFVGTASGQVDMYTQRDSTE